MRIVIAAVGRLKQGPERELAAAYIKRAAATGRSLGLREIEVVEIRESRAQDVERRRVEELIAIANVIPDGAVVVVLDQHGENPRQCGAGRGGAGLACRRSRGTVFHHRRRRRACTQPPGTGEGPARIRGRHLAAPDRPRHAARTALSRRDHSFRAPLSPGLKAGFTLSPFTIPASPICERLGRAAS